MYLETCIFIFVISLLKILGSMDEEHVSKPFQMLLDQQPNIKELTTHARTAQWKLLGVQLDWIV